MYLYCSIQATPKHWTKWLSPRELWYNTSFHCSLQCTPFKTMYGTDPSHGLFLTLKTTDHVEVADILKERQLFTKLLKEQLSIA
jgi:hypothetical protein